MVSTGFVGCESDAGPEGPAGPDVYVTGGHTWALAWDDEGEAVEAIEACTQCHGSATSFDAFNGQTTVNGLMDQLATLLVDEGILQLDTKYANEATYDPEVAAASQTPIDILEEVYTRVNLVLRWCLP